MEKNLIAYLEKAAIDFPNKIACAHEQATCTYLELQLKAKNVASHIIKICPPQNPVILFMDKNCEALIGLWGITYAGCCYVVIDPTLPIERISTIINTLEAKCIITTTNNLSKIPDLAFNGKILNIERMLDKAISPDEERKLDVIKENMCDIDPLYIMFTSGSTGIPKGVVVNHRSVIDFIDHFTQLFNIKADDIIGNQAPWDFDVSVKDIFSAVKVGATLEIIPKRKFSFPKELIDLLEEKKVTTLIWAVSALCILSSRNAFEYKVPSFINKVIFSGEVMPIKQFHIWRKTYPDTLFVNVYGPTEITCNCLYYIVEKEFGGDILPIGSPFPNERVFLLNEKNELIEKNSANQTGEICVSGTAVTMGYYNNKKATDMSFMQNPLNKRFIEIIYRTGDLGYYNQNELLCFSSRKDFQIKHMGHRIELGEIESAVNAINGIARACCLYDRNNIICFYEGEIFKKMIIEELNQKLPRYMIPAVFERIESMPVTKNGKIDRKILLDNFNKSRGL